jgi:hypothetical protein
VQRVLVCAATKAEHDACKRGIARADARHEMLVTGVGPVRAARALAERLSRASLPDRVVSSGFAGALSASLALSTWITAATLAEYGHEDDDEHSRVPVEAFAGLVACEVRSSDTLVSGEVPGRSGLPIAVDMESVALARECARRGVAFTVVRLVSDTPAHPLPAFLSPFTSALAATEAAARIGHAARGVRAALADPRGVGRLLADGPMWLRRLEDGWHRFARVRT